MAQVQLRIAAGKRWFFWPLFYAVVAAHWLGLVTDFVKSTDWLVEHGIRWDVA